MSMEPMITADQVSANATPRLAVSICLDVSTSMAGAPMEELNKGLVRFYEDLGRHAETRAGVELAPIAFADQARIVIEVTQDAPRPKRLPTLEVLLGGKSLKRGTNLGAAVSLALDWIDQRVAAYQELGVDRYPPFLVLMTDGHIYSAYRQIATEAAQRARVCEADSKLRLVVLPLGVGDEADMKTLALFSKDREPARLKGLDFGKFFDFLHRSLLQVSQSQPGDVIDLGWGTVCVPALEPGTAAGSP
jgi:uncharacterized protein YegL